MRSEHNRGASLAAFLLALSTVTLLMVSPVEGQGEACVVTAFPGEPEACPATDSQGNLLFCDTGTCEECCPSSGRFPTCQLSDCDRLFAGDGADQVANCQRECFDYYACATNADCPDALPFCNAGECGLECVVNADCPADRPFCNAGECEECVVTAFPGEPGSCPALDVQGNPLLCVSGLCFTCESADIAVLGDCADQFSGDADQIANCQRDCFAHYECTSNTDCPANEPTCIIIGQCRRECEVNALPGAAGSCPDIPAGQLFAGPEFCVQGGVTSVCIECARYEQELGITTAADCLILGGLGHTADDIANCERGCFGFYACGTNADCPPDRPLCESSQCLAECGTDADCPADRPFCDFGQCLCFINADCPPDRPLCDSGQCLCGTNADCPADRPLCESGQCLAECGTNANCPADRPLCESGQCLAECDTNADCPADRPLCESGQCLAECGTNADCPADRPLCDAGQCVVSSVPSSPTFSPLDGMGGGSSA